MLLALEDLELAGLSVGRALLCLLLLYTAYQRGSLAGAAAGLGGGLTADLCAGDGRRPLRRGLRPGGAAGGQPAAAAPGLGGPGLSGGRSWRPLPAEDLPQPLLPEAAAGTALFLLLPGRLFGGKRVKRAERRSSPPPWRGCGPS